jgi:hypothetical protein
MKANGAERRRFPGVITSGYPANNAFSAKMVHRKDDAAWENPVGG